jgi:hypothetical protein
LDNFEKTPNTSEPITKFVRREMLIFKCYEVDYKGIKCFFQWWAKHEAMLLIVVFWACQILGIAGSQIHTKKIFSLIKILTNLKRCCLQRNFLKRLISMSKN